MLVSCAQLCITPLNQTPSNKRDNNVPYTVNLGSLSCNFIVVNYKHRFPYLNLMVQTLKAKVTKCTLRLLHWNHLATKIPKYSLKFQKAVSTELVTSLEIHGCSFQFSQNLSVQKIDNRDVMNSAC